VAVTEQKDGFASAKEDGFASAKEDGFASAKRLLGSRSVLRLRRKLNEDGGSGKSEITSHGTGCQYNKEAGIAPSGELS
jgi:hypothetical protein